MANWRPKEYRRKVVAGRIAPAYAPTPDLTCVYSESSHATCEWVACRVSPQNSRTETVQCVTGFEKHVFMKRQLQHISGYSLIFHDSKNNTRRQKNCQIVTFWPNSSPFFWRKYTGSQRTQNDFFWKETIIVFVWKVIAKRIVHIVAAPAYSYCPWDFFNIFQNIWYLVSLLFARCSNLRVILEPFVRALTILGYSNCPNCP